MAESLSHISYVMNIVQYLSKVIPDYQYAVTQADLAEYGKRTPQVIGGYYPDVYYRTLDSFVIGEAKTDNDIDNYHTNAQIDCYIAELRSGCQTNKHLVLCTSFYSYAMMKNMIALKKRKEDLTDIKIHIIDNISKTSVL